MTSYRRIGMLLVSLAVISRPVSASTLFVDEIFNDNDWSGLISADTSTPPSTFGTRQTAAGGNPNEYREVTHTFGNDGLIRVAHLRDVGSSPFVWDPSLQGAIRSLDYSYDLINTFVSGSGSVATVDYRLMLSQGGKFYVSNFDDTVFLGQPWSLFGVNGLVATDFSELITGSNPGSAIIGTVIPTSHPDFTASGSPIIFGYESANSDPGMEMIVTTSGLDNYQLSVIAPQDFSWISPTGDWFFPNNWSDMAVPGAGDEATFFNGGTAMIPAMTTVEVAGLTVSEGSVENAGNLSVLGTSSIGDQAGSAGIVTVAGNGATWNSAGALRVGFQGMGTLAIQNGGVVTSASGRVGFHTDSTGEVTVDGAGSSWSNTNNLFVGEDGTGTLTIQNGGTVFNRNAFVGNQPSSLGTVIVDGSGSVWSNNVTLSVGDSGQGSVAIRNGARVVANGVIVGNQSGSSGAGTILLDDGELETSAPLQILPTGILHGIGTVTGDVTSSGHVAPGFSPGFIEIDGDFQQEFDGVLEIEVGGLIPGDEHDQLIVSGQANLDGRLEVPIINSPPFLPMPGTEITFLTAAAGVNGTFSAIVAPNLASVSPDVAIGVLYGPDDVRLSFVTPSTDALAPGVATASWSAPTSWGTKVPDSTVTVDLQNQSAVGANQRVEVAVENASAHQLRVAGNPVNGATTTLGVLNGNTLSVITNIVVDELGTIELNNGILFSPSVNVEGGGRLSGNGTVVGSVQVGTTLGVPGEATVSPGLSVGHLDVEGDYTQGEVGVLEIEVGNTPGADVDTIDVAGQALLGGTLRFDASTFEGPLGAEGRFTFLTAGDVVPLDDRSVFANVETVGNEDVYIAIALGNGDEEPVMTGGIGADLGTGSSTGYSSVLGQACPLGDMNCSGAVDSDDVPLIAQALVDPLGYEDHILFELGLFMSPHFIGDVDNLNNGLDFDDLDEFVTALNENGFGATVGSILAAVLALQNPVPEPSSVVAIILGGFLIMGTDRRRRND